MKYFLKTPLKIDEVRKLKVGDTVYLSGDIFTMRDQAHMRALKFFNEKKPIPVNISGGVIYHCGPVVHKKNSLWEVVSCGPTTSMRMEKIEGDLIKNYEVKMIIGKGGMGEKTLEALNQYGSVYASFTGGAGVLAAEKVKKIKSVFWLDLGVPEALWVFEVNKFGPLIVSMDSHKNNMYTRS